MKGKSCYSVPALFSGINGIPEYICYCSWFKQISPCGHYPHIGKPFRDPVFALAVQICCKYPGNKWSTVRIRFKNGITHSISKRRNRNHTSTFKLFVHPTPDLLR